LRLGSKGRYGLFAVLYNVFKGALQMSTFTLLFTFRVSGRRRKMYYGHARLCVCLSAASCLHYCTDPDVTWRSGRGCPLVVHYWADLQSVHGLRCYGNTRNAWQSAALIRQAQRTPHAQCHALRMPAKTPVVSANIDAPAAFAVPFRPYCGGVVTRMRNVSEYMLVLFLCLVTFCVSRRQRKMYCGHARLCVCLCVCLSVRGRTSTLLHGTGCNLGTW